jgi:hypothetical protein
MIMNEGHPVLDEIASIINEYTDDESKYLSKAQRERLEPCQSSIPWYVMCKGYIHKDGTRVILNKYLGDDIVLLKDSKYIHLATNENNEGKTLDVKIGDLNDRTPQQTSLPLSNDHYETTENISQTLTNHNLSYLVKTVKKYVPEDISVMMDLLDDFESKKEQKEKDDKDTSLMMAFNRWNGGKGI